MHKLRARMAVSVAMVAVLSVATAAPVAAATIRWAWVVARMPSTASYTPAAIDQGNSLGGTNTVTRSGEGLYNVFMGGMGTDGGGGNVQVGALASQPKFCVVDDWGSNGTDVTVSIKCFDDAGVAADSKFVIVFQDTNSIEGKAAYLYASDPTTTEPYEPNATYSYNSTGSANRITRLAVGKYIVFLEDLGSSRGSVQVSAYGDAALACRASRWELNFGHESVLVKCRDKLGTAVDAYFTLSFFQGQGPKGVSGSRSAYLWANQPSTSSYHPVAAYRWSSLDTVPTVTRSSIGAYSVELPGMPRGGAALVTPTGGGTSRCLVASIRTDAPPQRVGVRCFNLAGAPVDAAFTLAYLK